VEELISAALGLSPVDLLIHGRMVDVYRGVVTESYIGVKGDRDSLRREEAYEV